MLRVFKNIFNVMKADKLMRPSGRPGTGSCLTALCPLRSGEGCRGLDGMGMPRQHREKRAPFGGSVEGGQEDSANLGLETSGNGSGDTWLGRCGPKGSRGDARFCRGDGRDENTKIPLQRDQLASEEQRLRGS